MKSYIDSEYLEKLKDEYYKNGGECYAIAGCLCDNYILFGEGLKTSVIKEEYLNEWSSTMSFRMYNKMPEKYKKIIELLEDGYEDEATKKFFS